uniref:Cyclin IaZm n=1 Tax=Arundo donax TaxID=35708 RepID=A0A0A9LBG0_ARUDO
MQSENSASSVRKCSRKKVLNTLLLCCQPALRLHVGSLIRLQAIEDIDKLVGDNELAVVDYIEDICNFYKIAEHESWPFDYTDSHVDINSKMRAILANWII